MARRSRPPKNRSVRHVLHADMERRRTARRLRQSGHLLALGAVVLVVSGLAAHVATRWVVTRLFLENPAFALTTLELEIQGVMSREEVLERAGVQPGQNLIRLDLEATRARIASLPYVESVRLQRRLPGTLRLAVKEREPVARLLAGPADGEAEVYYLDASGHIMKPRPGERVRPLPLITGSFLGRAEEGARVHLPELLAALNLLRLAEFSTLRGELDLTQVELEAGGAILLRTASHGIIRFRADYLEQQLRRLAKIFHYAKANNRIIQTVDLQPERNVPVCFR